MALPVRPRILLCTALLLPCVAAATLSGCLAGGSSSTTQSGSFVSPATLASIEPGKTTQQWVQAMIGEPTSRITENGRDTWRYAFTRLARSSGFVLVIFGGSNSEQISQNTFVEFESGIVRRVWQDPAAPAVASASTPTDDH